MAKKYVVKELISWGPKMWMIVKLSKKHPVGGKPWGERYHPMNKFHSKKEATEKCKELNAKKK